MSHSSNIKHALHLLPGDNLITFCFQSITSYRPSETLPHLSTAHRYFPGTLRTLDTGKLLFPLETFWAGSTTRNSLEMGRIFGETSYLSEVIFRYFPYFSELVRTLNTYLDYNRRQAQHMS